MERFCECIKYCIIMLSLEEGMIKMKKKIKIIIALGIVVLCMGGYLVYSYIHQQNIMNSIHLEFNENTVIEYGDQVSAMDFVQSYEGEVACQDEIDTMTVGTQTIHFTVTKEKFSKEYSLDIEIKDTKNPEIVLAQEKVSIDYGGKYNLSDYVKSVTDPVDGELEFLTSDKITENQVGYYTYSDDVDTKKAGTYQVKIIAIDLNGNQSEKTIEIEVKEKVEVQTQTTTSQTQNTQTSNSQTSQTSSNTSKPSYTANPNNRVIVIDPGHQGKGNSATEAVGPGSSTKKAKVAAGATGVVSKVTESQINLDIGLKLRDELQARGYTVIMTRTSQNVNISNQERAQIGNNNQAAAVIHLHCDSASNSSARGAHTIAITKNNPYCSQLYSASSLLAQKVISSYCAATGISSRGVSYRDDLTGLNWSEVPAIYIEMGFISNATEDGLLTDSTFQYKCAKGIANGIDAYFQ